MRNYPYLSEGIIKCDLLLYVNPREQYITNILLTCSTIGVYMKSRIVVVISKNVKSKCAINV